MRGQRPEGRRRTKELNGVKEGVGRQAEIYSQRQRWESVIVLSTWRTPSRKTDTAPHTRCGAAAVNRQKHKMAEEGGPVWPSNRTMPGAPSGSSSRKHKPKPARAHTPLTSPFPQMSPLLMRSPQQRSNLSDEKQKWRDWDKTTREEVEAQAV